MSGPRPHPAATPRRFTTASGLELVASAWGTPTPARAPAKPPVILLHGGGQTRHAWKHTGEQLAAAGFYTLAVDLRGHGDSGWAGPEGYGLDCFVADLRTIAAALERPPVVVGASLGGITALLAQGEQPDLLAALVLVDVTPTVRQSGVEKIQQFMGAHAAEGFASVEEAAAVIAAYLPHRPKPRSLAGLAKNLRQHADGRYRWHWDPALLGFNQANLTPTTSERLAMVASALRLPVLLVRGGASELVSADDVAQFLARVPHARYVDITDARHMVAGDVNDAFGAAVLEFVSDLPTAV